MFCFAPEFFLGAFWAVSLERKFATEPAASVHWENAAQQIGMGGAILRSVSGAGHESRYEEVKINFLQWEK